MKITITPKNLTEYPLHTHDTHEIVYYVHGKGVMKTSQGNIPFEKGTILILPPHVAHCSVSENGFKNICVHVYDTLLNSEKVIIGKDNATQDVGALAEILARSAMHDACGSESFLAYLYNAYRELVLYCMEKPTGSAVELVREELVKNVANVDYVPSSALMGKGISEDHLRVLFKKAYGCTPIQYLTKRRIAFACNLFEVYGENMKINEVAYACGFNDGLYFSRCFKKNVGKTPKAYRAEYGKG